ncbi:MAG: TetR/AcrR family transcriptional regulator [Eggerthellaceae bacterium]
MARPKKNLNEPDARQRIIDEFWILLEKTHISKIGVKAITSAAHCNRTTFYYYFNDIYDLLQKAIAVEILESGNLPKFIFSVLSSQKYQDYINNDMSASAHRISVAMRQGGTGTVQRIISDQVCTMWSQLIHRSEKTLKPKTKTIIRYASCGMLGALFQEENIENAQSISDIFPGSFIERIVPTLVESVCEEEGIPTSDVVQNALA